MASQVKQPGYKRRSKGWYVAGYRNGRGRMVERGPFPSLLAATYAAARQNIHVWFYSR